MIMDNMQNRIIRPTLPYFVIICLIGAYRKAMTPTKIRKSGHSHV